MGNLIPSIKWEKFSWLLPWNRLGWSSNLYESDWIDRQNPPIAQNEYDVRYYYKAGSRATLAMDFFTRAEARFGIVPGVLRTRVRTKELGYTGGQAKNPSYYNRGDHVEAVDIEYDPTKITYKELLGHFWNGHDYTRDTTACPSIIFYHDKQQEIVARLSRQERQQYEEINLMAENPWPRKVATRILKCKKFWTAEPTAQKHTLHWHLNLFGWLGISTEKQIVWSTLAMRIHSLLMGEVEAKDIHSFLDKLQLKDEMYNYLLYQSYYQIDLGANTRSRKRQKFEDIII